jgi:hypothetical protein
VTELTYTAKVPNQGEVELPKRFKSEVAELFRGKEIEIIVRKKKKYRSSEQNRYYWGVVIPYILRAFIELGNALQEGNKEHIGLVHIFLKRRFLESKKVSNANGELIEFDPTTTGLTTFQFMGYLAEIGQWAAEDLHIVIPEPENF